MSACGTLFTGLLGDAYRQLPPAVRAFHDASLPACFAGRAKVVPARGILARWLARAARFPVDAGEVPITITVVVDGNGQRWSRQFGHRLMVSRLRRDGAFLRERLGLATLRFRLHGGPSGVQWHLVSVRLLGIPVPLSWCAGVRARESECDGRYRFSVGASFALIGHLVAYDGWLEPSV